MIPARYVHEASVYLFAGPTVLPEMRTDCWPHIVNKGFVPGFFVDPEFLFKRFSGIPERRLLCFRRSPVEPPQVQRACVPGSPGSVTRTAMIGHLLPISADKIIASWRACQRLEDSTIAPQANCHEPAPH